MENIELVKRQLWRNGYSAKDVTKYTDYDLLVEDQIRVEVKGADHKTNKDGVYWTITDMELKPKKFDVLAVVLKTPLNDKHIAYMRMNKYTVKNFYEQGLITGAGNNYKMNINLKILKTCFTTSLVDMFGSYVRD